jgi:hypothetical protein
MTSDDISATRRFLETGAHDRQIVSFFPVLLARASDQVCPAFGLQEFRGLMGAVLENPRIAGDSKTRGAAHYFNGLGFEKEGRLDDAVGQLDRSFEAWPEIDVRLRQVVWLLSANRPEDARQYLDLARQFREKRFWRRNLRDEDIESLQQMIDDRSRINAPTPK